MHSLLLLGAILATGPTQEKKSPLPFARWEKTIAALEARDRIHPPPTGAIHFCGSSSIRLWKIDKAFPDQKTVQRGFGGSQIADSTHFAPRIILPHQPRTIVFYAGDNDVAAGKTPETVRDDFRAFTRVIHDKLPQTRILFLSIKPSLARWKRIDQIRKANALIEADCKKDARLQFVDVSSPMLGAEGKPRPELFIADGLHLSPDGYDVWNKVVGKHLRDSGKTP